MATDFRWSIFGLRHIHNTKNHALDELTVDMENVVLKVSGHFTIWIKKESHSKGFVSVMMLN